MSLKKCQILRGQNTTNPELHTEHRAHTAIWFWSGFENHSYHFLLCNLGSNIHNQGLPERRPWRWDETQKGPVHGLLRVSLCCYNMLLDPTYRLP